MSILAHLDTLTAQFRQLHGTLPPLTFSADIDVNSRDITDADVYLRHYGLLDFPHHYLGTVNSGGFRVACQYWLPAQRRGTVFVVHGYFDHTGLYGHLIRYLLAQDLAVVAFDLPGHGLSDGEQVSIASFDHYVAVFEDVLNLARNNLPAPWHCVGQSTGGAIALKHLLQERATHHDFQNVAVLAPLLHPRRWRTNRLVYFLAHRWINQINRRFVKNSGDPAFVNFVANNDPLQASHIPLEWVGAMKRWIDEFHELPASEFPVRIIQGNQDLTLDWQYNLQQFSEKLPRAGVHIIDGAQHHLANESAPLRAQVFAALGLKA